MTDPQTLILVAGSALCLGATMTYLIGKLRSAPPRATSHLQGASFEDRAREAAKIIQACLPRDRYDPDDDVASIFSAERTWDDLYLPGLHLWGRDDEVLVFQGVILDTLYGILAPGTDPRSYRPYEPIYPRDSNTQDRIELSVNPHDLSPADLERISRDYAFPAPYDSQLAAYRGRQ